MDTFCPFFSCFHQLKQNWLYINIPSCTAIASVYGDKHLQKRTNPHYRRKAAVNFSLCWWTLANRLKKVPRTQKLVGVWPTSSLCVKSLIVFTKAWIKMSAKQIWKQWTRNRWKIKTYCHHGSFKNCWN